MMPILFAAVFWAASWRLNATLAARRSRHAAIRIAVPGIFGIAVLVIWECAVRGLDVPEVILPAPSAIASAFASSLDILRIDFVQTVVKGALPGYFIGLLLAILFTFATDRSPFLRRGLLPVGNFAAVLPIVGTAPIFVMWFGFGWQSKAAVVVAMVFFPMLTSFVQGLGSADREHRELMHTYNATYWQTLTKLRLPTALPFAFSGLKVCTTLALIGAIVAEFFGSPIMGMGFRISTEAGRLAMDVVWAEIVVAAIAGALFFGAVSLLAGRTIFWHPSQRAGSGR